MWPTSSATHSPDRVHTCLGAAVEGNQVSGQQRSGRPASNHAWSKGSSSSSSSSSSSGQEQLGRTAGARSSPAQHLERLVVRGGDHAHIGEQRQASAGKRGKHAHTICTCVCSHRSKHPCSLLATSQFICCTRPDAPAQQAMSPTHRTESECAGMVCVHLPPDHTRMVQSPLPDSRSPLGSCSRHSTAASCPSNTCVVCDAAVLGEDEASSALQPSSRQDRMLDMQHVHINSRSCAHKIAPASEDTPARTARRARCGSSCRAKRTQYHPPESPARQRPAEQGQQGACGAVHIGWQCGRSAE